MRIYISKNIYVFMYDDLIFKRLLSSNLKILPELPCMRHVFVCSGLVALAGDGSSQDWH